MALHYLRQREYLLRVVDFQKCEVFNPKTLKLQHLLNNVNKTTPSLNKYLTHHRMLSGQSSLKMHYPIHTRERHLGTRGEAGVLQRFKTLVT